MLLNAGPQFGCDIVLNVIRELASYLGATDKNDLLQLVPPCFRCSLLLRGDNDLR